MISHWQKDQYSKNDYQIINFGSVGYCIQSNHLEKFFMALQDFQIPNRIYHPMCFYTAHKTKVEAEQAIENFLNAINNPTEQNQKEYQTDSFQLMEQYKDFNKGFSNG